MNDVFPMPFSPSTPIVSLWCIFPSFASSLNVPSFFFTSLHALTIVFPSLCSGGFVPNFISWSLNRMFSSLRYPERYTFIPTRVVFGRLTTPNTPSFPYMRCTRSVM